MSTVTREDAYAFLLGELDASAAEALEAELFEDDAVHEQLKALEAELIDDYVAGDLPEARRARFEARYADGEQRARVETARALRARAVEATPTAGLWARARAWLEGVGGWGWGVALAAAMVLLSIGLGLGPLGPGSTPTRITLTPDVLRAAQAPPAVTLADTPTLVLELALDGAAASASAELRLRRGQAVVATYPAMHADAVAVVVQIPAADLTPGSYTAELWSAPSDGELVATYAFDAR